MPIFQLPPEPIFPDPCHADKNGLLAVGGDLSPERLINGYSRGIFPWYNEDSPLLWWSPDPRHVIFPNRIKVPRSLKKAVRCGAFELRIDSDFESVIQACASTKRKDQDGTWIVRPMMDAYKKLHELGYAHSFESWSNGDLVGGLYGVNIGGVFAGESMFSNVPESSKFALLALCRFAQATSVEVIDCQFETPFLISMGGENIPREKYLSLLAESSNNDSDWATKQAAFLTNASWHGL